MDVDDAPVLNHALREMSPDDNNSLYPPPPSSFLSNAGRELDRLIFESIGEIGMPKYLLGIIELAGH